VCYDSEQERLAYGLMASHHCWGMIERIVHGDAGAGTPNAGGIHRLIGA